MRVGNALQFLYLFWLRYNGTCVYILGDLAQQFEAELVGDAQCTIRRVATLNSAGKGDISFLSNSVYRKHLETTSASAVIVKEEDKALLKTNGLVVNDPYVTYAKIAALLYPPLKASEGIHPTATVHPDSQVAESASIGPNCFIDKGTVVGANSIVGPGCVIERDAVLGEACYLHANVTICHRSVIGNQVILHPGVVIGSDGFGLANDNGNWLKIPQVGTVRVGNDVEIGANSTIDRGAIEDTVLEDGVKLDNLIQVAHNVHIGANTAIAAAAAIAGSVRIGKNCQIGGKVGIVGHIEIADNVVVTAMSLVTHSIRQSGVFSSGTPLQANKQWLKNTVRIKQLDDLARTVKKLEQQSSKK